MNNYILLHNEVLNALNGIVSGSGYYGFDLLSEASKIALSGDDTVLTDTKIIRLENEAFPFSTGTNVASLPVVEQQTESKVPLTAISENVVATAQSKAVADLEKKIQQVNNDLVLHNAADSGVHNSGQYKILNTGDLIEG